MIRPIVAYGQPILRTKCQEIDLNSPQIPALIQDLYETMYNSNGVGLASPQINENFRAFVVDSTHANIDEKRQSKTNPGYKGIFINPVMIEEFGEVVEMEEGCLSIPKIYGMVERPSKIKIEFYDDNLQKQVKEFDGFTARVIQHEYDHIEGVLFIDHLKPIKKTLLKKKLEAIKLGKINPTYKMIFAKLK